MSYVIFGTHNTFTDYGFLLAPYIIPMPEVQTNMVEIPGRDGLLDLSEGFGLVRYANRSIELTLYKKKPFDSAISSFVNAVHGKRLNVTFDRDTDYYYTGRVTVTGIEKNDGYCTLSVTIDSVPYKYKQSVTTVTQEGDGAVSLTNGKMSVVPTVVCTASVTLAYTIDGSTYATMLAAGTHIVPSLLLTENSTTAVTVTTTGTVTFTYREGAL